MSQLKEWDNRYKIQLKLRVHVSVCTSNYCVSVITLHREFFHTSIQYRSSKCQDQNSEQQISERILNTHKLQTITKTKGLTKYFVFFFVIEINFQSFLVISNSSIDVWLHYELRERVI